MRLKSKNKIKFNKIKLQLIIYILAVVLTFSYIAVLYFHNAAVKEFVKQNEIIVTNDEIDKMFTLSVSVISDRENSVLVKGEIYKKNEDVGYVQNYILLKNTEIEKMYKINTKYSKNNEDENDDKVVGNGFYAQVLKRKIQKGNYQVVILHKTYDGDKDYLLFTNRYIDI